MSSISDIDLDLEKLFQPAWAQEKPATNRFDRFTGNEGVKPERRFNDKPANAAPRAATMPAAASVRVRRKIRR